MKWFRRYWPYAALALLVALNGVAIWQRQWIGDWMRLHGYEAPPEIASLASATSMTGEAKHYFYINHPVLEAKQGFNKHCADLDAETAVLGCYHGNRQGIYLYAVEDERLAGVREVTAAHEMLHQAYDRLSSGERKHIDDLLHDYYGNHLTDTTIRDKLENYKKQAGVVLTSEMHSIFGSEVRNLTPELETYYKRYFTDRRKVVALSENYQGELTRRQDLVREYDQQLTGLKSKIDANKSNLDTRLRALRSKEKEINEAANRQDMAAYREAVAAYNAQVEEYNTKVNTTRGLIDDYNDIVAARNSIAVEEQELQQALDSQLAPTQ